MKTMAQHKGLSSEVIHKLTEIKCDECGVNFDFCFNHIIKINPATRDEFEKEMETFLANAYFTDFYSLFTGFISYRKCADTVDDALKTHYGKKHEKQKFGKVN